MGEAFVAVVVANSVGAYLAEVAAMGALAAVGEVRGDMDLAAGFQVFVAVREARIAAVDTRAFGAGGRAVFVVAAGGVIERCPGDGILVGVAAGAGVARLVGGGHAAGAVDGAVVGFQLVFAGAVAHAGIRGAIEIVVALVGAAVTRGAHAAVLEAAEISIVALAGGGQVAVANGMPIAKPGASWSSVSSPSLTTQDLPSPSTPVIIVRMRRPLVGPCGS